MCSWRRHNSQKEQRGVGNHLQRQRGTNTSDAQKTRPRTSWEQPTRQRGSPPSVLPSCWSWPRLEPVESGEALGVMGWSRLPLPFPQGTYQTLPDTHVGGKVVKWDVLFARWRGNQRCGDGALPSLVTPSSEPSPFWNVSKKKKEKSIKVNGFVTLLEKKKILKILTHQAIGEAMQISQVKMLIFSPTNFNGPHQPWCKYSYIASLAKGETLLNIHNNNINRFHSWHIILIGQTSSICLFATINFNTRQKGTAALSQLACTYIDFKYLK